MTTPVPTATRRRATTIAAVVGISTIVMIPGAMLLGTATVVILSAVVMSIALTVLDMTICDDIVHTTWSLRADLTTNIVLASIVASVLAVASGITGQGS